MMHGAVMMGRLVMGRVVVGRHGGMGRAAHRGEQGPILQL